MNISQFLWKYIAGPIVADATNTESLTWKGVEAFKGYNLFNTVLWALIAVLTVYGCYRLFDRYGIEFNLDKVFYSLPFVFLGGVLRFLEDTGLVPFPYSIILITPIIYSFILLLFLTSLSLSIKLKNWYEISENRILLYSGLVLLLIPLILVFNYFASNGLNTSLLALPLILPTLATIMYRFIVKDSSLDAPAYQLILFSQVFGGAASMTAVTQGFEQKQLLTRFFTGVFGVSGVLVAKLALTGLVIYSLSDIEDEQIEALTVLVMTVIGLGTGLRVLLRMVAGI